MIDSIVIISCIEALVLFLLGICDALIFETACITIFFFALILCWMSCKELKK